MVNEPVSMETSKHHGRLGEGFEERSGSSSSDGCRTKTVYSERGAWRGRRWQADGGEVGRAKVLGEGRHWDLNECVCGGGWGGGRMPIWGPVLHLHHLHRWLENKENKEAQEGPAPQLPPLKTVHLN